MTYDHATADGEDLKQPDAELIRRLPDEKIERLAGIANGRIKHCPECGALTGFFGRPTYNDYDECHNCGYEEKV